MKIITSDLTGLALDWAVATCEGLPIRHDPMNFGRAFPEGGFWIWDDRGPIGKRDYRLIGRQYSPSTNWAIGGPIIEQELICIERNFHSNDWTAWTPAPELKKGEAFGSGPTPLIAGMRCYVASKLGDEVDVPEELT